MRKFIWVSFLFTIIAIVPTSVTHAQRQDACPALAREALASVAQTCDGTGRNQACYGNFLMTGIPQPTAQDFNFSDPGDIVNVGDIASLRLNSMDVDNDYWGVALMRLQANIPDTLPGQNVTFLLFGDVEIENQVDSSQIYTKVQASVGTNLNVRSGPSTDYAVVTALRPGETITLNGRNEAGDWLRVERPDTVAWVFTSLIEVNGDIETLAVVDVNDEYTPQNFTPMQAFYFRSGIGDAPCEEAPESGILIQTPEGVGEIDLVVNQVNVSLGSTGFLQGGGLPGGDNGGTSPTTPTITLTVIEGTGTMEYNGVSISIPAGGSGQIEVDEDGNPIGTPSIATYPPGSTNSLPVNNLDREIDPAEGLTEEELRQLLLEGAPNEGAWAGNVFDVTCAGNVIEIGVSDTEFSIDDNGNLVSPRFTANRIAPGVYRFRVAGTSPDINFDRTIQFVVADPDTLNVNISLSVVYTSGASCSFDENITMTHA